MAEPVKSGYKFGLFEVDIDSGELFRGGTKIRMQEQPFQVLLSLLEHPNEVVTREELRERLWAGDTFVDFDHSLNTAINKLRDALGDGAGNPRFIETIPRRGYRFIAPVQKIEDGAGQDVASATAPLSSAAEPIAPPQLSGVELPQAHPATALVLFGALQLMYLIIYAVALWRTDEVQLRAEAANISSTLVLVLVLLTGVVGVALRLYTLTATLFQYRHLGRNFQRLFPGVLILDVIWATSPFLLAHKIGIGLAFAACAALVYSPFAQRVLAILAFPPER